MDRGVIEMLAVLLRLVLEIGISVIGRDHGLTL